MTDILHPYSMIGDYLSSMCPPDSKVHLSRYHYSPQTVADSRVVCELQLSEFSWSVVSHLQSELGSDEELAFHSTITMPSGDQRHLPMLDFSGHVDHEAVATLRSVLGANLTASLRLYTSGRSYHGYFLCLLDHEEWHKLMGTFLLLNLPDRPPVADARWVGHRLRAGYAALRWSANTRHYLAPPRAVQQGSSQGV